MDHEIFQVKDNCLGVTSKQKKIGKGITYDADLSRVYQLFKWGENYVSTIFNGVNNIF